MKITLDSSSKHKIEAVKKACVSVGIDAEFSVTKTPSGVREQPVGFEETFRGALARAKGARKADPRAVAIGIESGIFRFGGTTLDMAIIAILTPDGRQIIASSAGFEFPEEYVKIAEARGFESTTVGSVIAEKFGGDSTDPHSALSGGKVSRSEILAEALALGLRQI